MTAAKAHTPIEAGTKEPPTADTFAIKITPALRAVKPVKGKGTGPGSNSSSF